VAAVDMANEAMVTSIWAVKTSPAALLIVVVTVGTKVAAMVAWAAVVIMAFTLP